MRTAVLTRTFDAARLNRLANDPAIRPHIGGDLAASVDLTPAIADLDSHWLTGEHGAFGFVWTAPRTYEVHTLVAASDRGRWAYAAAREALAHMAALGARLVWTRVAPAARHVLAFAVAAGFRPVGTRTSREGNTLRTYTTLEWEPR